MISGLMIPDWIWRGGTVRRVLGIGLPAGALLGAFAFADSGSVLGFVLAAIVCGFVYGVGMTWRMGRSWPRAHELDAADRVAVIRAVRHGEKISEDRLAPDVVEYCERLREAQEKRHPYRWLIPAGAVLALIIAVFDTLAGSVLSALVSWLILAFFLVELLWWPKRQARFLANVERAEALARRSSSIEPPGDTD
jgi:Flp pilus assembly protein TadB